MVQVFMLILIIGIGADRKQVEETLYFRSIRIIHLRGDYHHADDGDHDDCHLSSSYVAVLYHRRHLIPPSMNV